VISIRGGSGLGDALYLQAVVRQLVKDGEQVEVCSDWREVFSQLPVKVSPFRRDRINRLAHYSAKKGLVGTTQFDDVCSTAGVKAELKLDWKPTSKVGEQLKEDGRPIVCVQLPRNPMGRTDGFGAELLPDCKAIQTAIDALRWRALIVQVGAGKSLHNFTGIDVDLSNRTTVSELIDVAQAADAFVGYVSFIVPLAECLDKPALLVWSRRGLKAGDYVRRITPQKILHKPSSKWVMDDDTNETIASAANALF
jgi:hypothetical protein